MHTTVTPSGIYVVEDFKPTKWCTYCRKDNHSDDECWCTRTVQRPTTTLKCNLVDLKTDTELLAKLYAAARGNQNASSATDQSSQTKDS